MNKKVTLIDIANKVGVSKGLVSLALSDSDLVNDETRAEIVLAALELGYNLDKRKIRKTRKTVFSLIVQETSYVNEFFWTEVIKGMEMSMAEAGIGLDLIVYDDNERNTLLELVNKKSNGLIVVSASGIERVNNLKKSGLPLVIVDGDSFFGNDCDSVSANNYLSGYEAARYFIDKGHRRLAYVGSVDYSMSFNERRNGFRDCALKNADAEYYEVISDGDAKYETFDYKKFRALMRRDRPPTAIMCCNDYTAIKLYDILTDIGFGVPDDVSLIGFDGICIDHHYISHLTTFGLDKVAFGRQAVNLLCERIKNPDAPLKRVEILTEFIERESVRDLKIV